MSFLATSECENQSSVAAEIPDKPQLAYACCVCKKIFQDLFSAVRHIKSHVTRLSRKGEFAMHCGECGKGFTTKQQLSKHETVHSDVRPFKCDVCDKWFKTPDNVKRHMIVHNDVKPFSCTTCGKNFKAKQMLRKHMEIHTDQRVYECPKCDKKYKAKNSLRDHLRVHSGQRPYKCQQCDQAFYRPSHLATHKVVHSNVKPFACKDCDKKFGRKEHLKVHERIHSGEKPFKCKLCDRAFNQQAGLQAHMVSHSEERPHACPKCNKAFKYPSQIKHHACKPELRPSMVFDRNIVDTCGSQETFSDPVGEATSDVTDPRSVKDQITNDPGGVCLNPSETIILIQIQNDHQHMQSVLGTEQRLPGASQLIGNMAGAQVNMGNMLTQSAGSAGVLSEQHLNDEMRNHSNTNSSGMAVGIEDLVTTEFLAKT